ncbi:hypothetical protein BBO_05203 [Beauveria brongniartii RCEF 3172]|uniref:HypA-like protein n=1 Tax=Beauveria brongniartii RCEF 3172 TaxID=1081107 RepID=A0A167D1S3_9HYPO|nr:hypothetical protein BBO_05203 [Beauveria brongniartii RCEF 3172]
MASPTHILVRADETGLLGMTQTPEAAAKVSALLQEDMEKHNVFFNEKGYHNHLVHQLLTLYGTGATPEDMQRGYDNNISYQLKRNEQGEEVQCALHDNFDEAAKEFFGRGRYYGNFLRFYQEEIEKLGWQETVLKYLIHNEQNFTRLFSGLLHPYLQLMYGLEWAQPALVAEGLAQTSIHRDNYGALFAAVDEKARRNLPAPRHFAELLETIGDEHPQLVAEPKLEDGDGSQTTVLNRIPDQVAEYLAANVRVDPDSNLDEQIDAMVHASAHHNNLTPAFLWLKTQDWIPVAAKARLLEWKLRTGVLTFLSRGSPRLDVDALRRYVPNDIRTGRARAMVASPEELLPRLHAVADDGHVIKVARAFLLAQRASRPYLDRAQRPAWIRLADDETWLKAHYALLDSVEGADVDAGKESRWVRSAGFDGAWEDVPKM